MALSPHLSEMHASVLGSTRMGGVFTGMGGVFTGMGGVHTRMGGVCTFFIGRNR